MEGVHVLISGKVFKPKKVGKVVLKSVFFNVSVLNLVDYAVHSFYPKPSYEKL